MRINMLLETREVYKPFDYPFAYEYWLKQQKMHWIPEEVPMARDVEDYNYKLTPEYKELLTKLFRFFTQADIDVAGNYRKLASIPFPPEVQMMMQAFANMETVHIAAYSHLIDTLGLPEKEYAEFLAVEEMREKHDYLCELKPSKYDPQKTYDFIIASSGFGEGMQLFSTFAALLYFQKKNLMNGMCNIVAWSIRDETLHCEGMLAVANTLCKEYSLSKDNCYRSARTMVDLEDSFIDFVFGGARVDTVHAQNMKEFNRYIADIRLKQMGCNPIYNIKNPYPWFWELVNTQEHANFFERKPTEYSKVNYSGSWNGINWDIFA